jgi:hypothetical protein
MAFLSGQHWQRKNNRDDLSPLVMPWSERQVFSITPVIAGAGRTGAMIGIGIGLIALQFLGPAVGGFLVLAHLVLVQQQQLQLHFLDLLEEFAVLIGGIGVVTCSRRNCPTYFTTANLFKCRTW